MESVGPMKGGLWNSQKPTFSAQTQNLLKVMMQESKLTNFQRRTISDTVNNGRSLPPRVAPSFTIQEKLVIPKAPPSKRVNPRTYKNGLRKLDDIIDSGAYEKADFKPRPLKAVTDKDKDRLAHIMAFGKDLNTMPFKTEKEESSPEPEPELDRFEELRLEVEDRKNFLNEMISLGKGREYKNVITTEISQKIREMELIDQKRTSELKKLLEN